MMTDKDMAVAAASVRSESPTTWKSRLKQAARAYTVPTSRLRPLPEFLIIGAQRTGTTSLYKYLSDTIGYWGGHYDFLDGGAYKRKHAAAIDFNNNVAANWDPELDTSEGVFTVEVVPHRMVIYGGNFSRVNRRPQPGIAVFQPGAGGEP